MRVRAATALDIEAVVALERSIATAPHWTKEAYRQIAGEARLPRCLLVAEMDSRIMGFAVGSIVDDAAELESVAVAETARRGGMGRELCRAVMDWATELGAIHIDLEVRSGGGAARALYATLGFYEVGRRRAYYRQPVEDAILMRFDCVAKDAGRT